MKRYYEVMVTYDDTYTYVERLNSYECALDYFYSKVNKRINYVRNIKVNLIKHDIDSKYPIVLRTLEIKNMEA